MKAIVLTYVTGKYGKPGEKVVDLNKVEYFKNGRINKAATLRNGYKVIEILKDSYGFGTKTETIAEIIDEIKRS